MVRPNPFGSTLDHTAMPHSIEASRRYWAASLANESFDNVAELIGERTTLKTR